MMKKNRKKRNRKLFNVLIICISIFIVIDLLYIVQKHVKRIKSNTVNIVLNEGDLIVNYLDGNSFSFNDSKEHEYAISVTNNGKDKVYYSLNLESLITSKGLNIVVYDEDSKIIYNQTDIISDTQLFSLLELDHDQTARYKIMISGTKKVSVDGIFRISNDSITTQTFSDLILLNNNIKESSTKVGTELATKDEGLISLQDNKGLAYYFRGNVKNNYVRINELLYRIVRINGDGTVRLVLDGVADKMPYNSNVLAEGEEAKMLGVFGKSSILTYLDTWLENNLGNYKHLIENADYCETSEFNEFINGFNRSSAYTRTYVDNAPSLMCSSGVYTGKIGLLQADEVILAGALPGIKNTEYYLYKDSIKGSSLLASPNYINNSNQVVVMSIGENGSLEEGVLVTEPLYIRPVISLSTSAKVKGRGTLDDPYLIVS